MIEVGVGSAPTLANLAKGSLALPDHGGLRPSVFNVEADRLVVFGEDEDAPVVDEPVEADEATAAAAPEAPEPAAAPAPAAAPSGGGATVADQPVTTAEALVAMLSLQLKFRPDQLTPSSRRPRSRCSTCPS